MLIGASYRYVLTVPGRKTGRLYSTPVDALEVAGDRWLVAAYGRCSGDDRSTARRLALLSRQ